MAPYAGLAVSNIAWPHADFPEALDLVAQLGAHGVEIAPYNVFGGWNPSDDEVREVRRRIEAKGLICPALQGILFNVPGAALFGGSESRTIMAEQLVKVARMAGLLGASACVFGAPRQRDPGDLDPAEVREVAAEFFRRIGPTFAENGTCLSFEANSSAYDCRFITTTAEAIEFVNYVGSNGVGLQIDMGTIFLENEPPEILSAAAPVAMHAHVSEPGLRPIGTGGVCHGALAHALKDSGYQGMLSIEMRAVDNWRKALSDAVYLTKEQYL